MTALYIGIYFEVNVCSVLAAPLPEQEGTEAQSGEDIYITIEQEEISKPFSTPEPLPQDRKVG